MNSSPVDYRWLKSGDAQQIASLALLARQDKAHTGTRAMSIARDLTTLGHDPVAIVQEVYMQRSSRQSENWEAWECGHCGEVHLGKQPADACCTTTEIE